VKNITVAGQESLQDITAEPQVCSWSERKLYHIKLEETILHFFTRRHPQLLAEGIVQLTHTRYQETKHASKSISNEVLVNHRGGERLFALSRSAWSCDLKSNRSVSRMPHQPFFIGKR